jgi:hypothetical protein
MIIKLICENCDHEIESSVGTINKTMNSFDECGFCGAEICPGCKPRHDEGCSDV